MAFLLFPFIIMIGVLVFIVSSKRMKAIHAAWDRAAAELRLSAGGGGFSAPTLNGQMGGLRVAVNVYSTGGKNKTYWTRYRATFPTKNTALHLKRQTGLSRVTKFFGARDVEIGDVTFDDAFMIQADSDARAMQYLTLPRRTLLLKLFSLYRGVELTPDRLEITIRGYEDKTADLVTTTRRMVSAARLLAGMVDEPPVERSLRQRAQGDMSAAAAELREFEPTPDDLDVSLLEAEVLAGSGEFEAAQPILVELAEKLPADEEVAGLQRAIERMTPDEPAPDKRSVDMQEILDDLFVSNRLSFETTEIFDEHYLGRNVTWRGQVKSMRDFRSDLDFGDGPGTKLVVAIAEVEHDLYGVSEVDAIVALPADSASHLSRGDRVTFTGRLLKADSMMRNIYIAAGRLM
ncbi:MAG: tetratricopeptide repeat protein [bacterium]|nr:tetratricopeptide repeat protein [bacterium]